jgi:hypothetical protein
MKRALDCNQDRVKLARSLLQPNPDGSLNLAHLKLDGGKIKGRDAISWSKDDLAKKITALRTLSQELVNLKSELTTYTYSIPADADLISRVLIWNGQLVSEFPK